MRLSKSSDELILEREVALLDEHRAAVAFMLRLQHLISVQVIRGTGWSSMGRLWREQGKTKWQCCETGICRSHKCKRSFFSPQILFPQTPMQFHKKAPVEDALKLRTCSLLHFHDDCIWEPHWDWEMSI